MGKISKLALAAAGGLALAGCGGSSSAGVSTTSNAAFVSRVSAICTKVNADVEALPAINTAAELAKTGTQELNLSTAAIGQLKALTPPPAKKTAFGQYVAGLDRESALLRSALAAMKAGDAAKAQTIAAQGSSLDASGNAKARSLGLAACAQDSQPGASSSSSSA